MYLNVKIRTSLNYSQEVVASSVALCPPFSSPAERATLFDTVLAEPAFVLDQRTQDAVIRNFEVIGEACNNVA